MAIACARCGRQYDVTRFEFGRTIDCSCGGRVGLEARVNLPENAELRFFVDVNAARLVRWLRALGFDAAWEDAIADGELVRRALRENRYILTLDKRLPAEWRVGNVLLLTSGKAIEQLSQVVKHFGINPPRRMFTRCLICNALLREARREDIARLELERAAGRGAFRYCPNCRQVYWEGSHTRRMRAQIEQIFQAGRLVERNVSANLETDL